MQRQPFCLHVSRLQSVLGRSPLRVRRLCGRRHAQMIGDITDHELVEAWPGLNLTQRCMRLHRRHGLSWVSPGSAVFPACMCLVSPITHVQAAEPLNDGRAGACREADCRRCSLRHLRRGLPGLGKCNQKRSMRSTAIPLPAALLDGGDWYTVAPSGSRPASDVPEHASWMHQISCPYCSGPHRTPLYECRAPAGQLPRPRLLRRWPEAPPGLLRLGRLPRLLEGP